MRVRWRRILNPLSRKPVRMKLTGERYPNARHEKEKKFQLRASFSLGPYDSWDEWARWKLLFRFGQFRQHTKVFERSRVAGDSRPAGDFFQQSTHNFTTTGFWERFGETNFIWFCNCPD